MTQAPRKIVTFAEFISWKPDGERYELHDGVVVKMAQPLGGYEEITGFLSIQLAVQCYQSGLPYLLPKTALVKPIDSDSAYSPDTPLLSLSGLNK